MEISALNSSLDAQTSMGMLLVKVLSQSQELLKQQSAVTSAPSPAVGGQVSIDGVGENVDVTA